MNIERIKKYTYVIFFVLGISILFYFFMKYVFMIILPFLIAWFFAFAMRPLALSLSEKTKIKPKYIRFMLTVISILLTASLLSLGIWILSREVWELVSRIDGGDVEGFISSVIGGGVIGDILSRFGDKFTDGLYNVIVSLLASLGTALSSYAAAIPNALLFVLITVIAAVYFSLELEYINSAIKKLLPTAVFEFLVRMKNGFLKAFISYMRSYLLLLVITFAEMLIGLSLIRAPYPLIMAIVIAVLDLLPVLGVGSVLVPWAIWMLICGNIWLGTALLLLLVIHTVFREIIEPKIVGKHLGVHPVLTLVLIYVGYSLFGFTGLIMVPVFTVLLGIVIGEKDSSEVM